MAITWTGAVWAQATAYQIGARVVHAGNVYECATAGTSADFGGPTGTDSPITDGTVEWTWLGANTGSVVDVAPDVANVSAGSQRVFLGLAERLVADAGLWLDLLDDGRRYLAAHFGELSILRGHGPITSEAVGALSRGYASLMGDFAVDLTPCGRVYMDLVRTLPTTMGYVVGQ